MSATNYWMTFTAGTDATREVLAVRLVHELSADHTTGRAEAPALEIVIENDARALILVIDAVSREIAKRYAHLNLRLGAMTVAPAGEKRNLAWADDAEPVFPVADYEVILNNPNRRAHALERLAVLFDVESASAEEGSEVIGVHTLDSTLGQLNINPSTPVEGFDGEDLCVVSPTVQPAIVDISFLETINRRCVDDDFPLEDAHMPGRFGLGHAARDGLLPRQGCFFFVDDIPGEDAQSKLQFSPDRKSPSGKIDVRGNDSNLPDIFGHPGQRFTLIDNPSFADDISAEFSAFINKHLARIGIDRPNDDSPLMTGRSAAIVDNDQHLARASRSGQHTDCILPHSTTPHCFADSTRLSYAG